MSSDSLHLRIDAATSQRRRFKVLIGEFFRTQFNRAGPTMGSYEVSITIERTLGAPSHDVDDVARAVLEALTGVIFHHESQVEKLLVEKVDGDRSRVRVNARPMPIPAAA